MNWLTSIMTKEAGRRFKMNDKVRYFTKRNKGTGKGLVLTPSFSRGTVSGYDNQTNRYQITNSEGQSVDVHPRNLMLDS